MLGVIYVETKPFLSFRCITSIRTFRLAPFSPIAASIVFNRFNLASSRFEVVGVEGVEGFLTCMVVWLCGELVWLYGCVAFLLNVTHTKDAFWLYSGSGRFASLQASMMRLTPLPQFSKNVVLKSTSAMVGFCVRINKSLL